LCAGAYRGGEQVGFARLVTDYATFGYLTDVYVATEHRGNGLAREMSRALLEDGAVARVGHFVLIAARGAARTAYGELGFSPLRAPEVWMEMRKAT
jgi:ribosomal protein S18 acetylase RimI-like enzyme